MKPEGRTIKELLNGKKQMIIPDYQREFTWNAVEGQDFFEDVNLRKEGKPLFIGTFIFNNGEDEVEKRDKDKIEIIDGQQRITTILVLLIACRVYARDENFDEELAMNLQHRIALQSTRIMNKGSCRLITNGKIGKALNKMSHLDWDGKYEKLTMGNKRDWNSIEKPYKFFYNQFKKYGYDKEKIDALEKKISDIIYVEIIVENPAEAIETFEVVNARGQHLAVNDLIKAFLFGRAHDKKSELKSDKFKEDWKEITKAAGDTDFKKMLHLFHFSKAGYILPAKLYRSLKKMANDSPGEFVDDLKSFSKFYSIIFTNSGIFRDDLRAFISTEMKLADHLVQYQGKYERVMKSLFALRLFKVETVFPLIYSSLLCLSTRCQDDKITNKRKNREIVTWISMLEFFERFLFVSVRISHGLSKYGGRLQKLYGKSCEKFYDQEGDFIEEIKSLQSSMRDMKVTKEKFMEGFVSISHAKDKEIIHYIFDNLNAPNSKLGNRTSLLNFDSYVESLYNIEHFLAQSNEEKDYVHSIGNLFTIHRDLNSKLANRDLDEKVRIIQEWLKIGNISNMPYLQKFVNYYNEKTKSKKWGEELVKARTKDIANEIYDLMQV